jgi:alginate O-acetyltransferase complex protein AlgI
MTFTSIAFLVFVPLVTIAYYLCPPRYRWAVLLFASCYFYMAFVPSYLLVLFLLIGIDFFLAQQIEHTTGARKKIIFIIGIVATVSILFVFKYFNFFNANLAALAQLLDWNYSAVSLRLLLPLGLSFHTFQSLSYLIEVYRGKYKTVRHLGVYALYVMFFPQLVAGPIERPQHLIPQLTSTQSFNVKRTESGLRLIAWGFFKKLVIADQLAVSVDYVYHHAATTPGPSVIITMIFFAFQLYADFSGYTDISRGSARLLGIELVYNFKQPYFSKSIAEFWRRWHISLSSWFRDYFYTPLIYVAPRLSMTWLYMCIFITFLVTGFWHGAGWTFIAMGALFGLYIVFGLATRKLREKFVRTSGLARVPKIHAFLQILFTFTLVCVAWVFFRAPDLHTADTLFSRLSKGWEMSLSQYVNGYILQPFWTLGISRYTLLVSLVCIAGLLFLEYKEQKTSLGVWLDKQPLLVRSFSYSSVLFMIILYGTFSAPLFIYFQF